MQLVVVILLDRPCTNKLIVVREYTSMPAPKKAAYKLANACNNDNNRELVYGLSRGNDKSFFGGGSAPEGILIRAQGHPQTRPNL